MPFEIERKFLVDSDLVAQMGKPAGTLLAQGYLSSDPHRTVRIRISHREAFLTIKGISTGATRLEWEYPIPMADAQILLEQLCPTVLSKTRYKILFAGKTWDLDVFHGDLKGLVLAEIELESEDEAFELPDWVGLEVTDDPRYYNVNLIGKRIDEL